MANKSFLDCLFSFFTFFLHDDGALLIFYQNDPKVFRQINAYLVANNFQVFQKWIICNHMLKLA
jgi:hypothetical protein